MKKIIPGSIVAALAVSGLLLTPAAASATDEVDSFGICTPADAWTETIEHAAVGEPTIEIENPDYVAPTYKPGYWQDVPATYTPPVGKPTIWETQSNPDYREAVAEVPEISHTDYVAERYVVDAPAQAAVTKTQWKYEQNGGNDTIWLDYYSHGKVWVNGKKYQSTNKTRVVEVTPAVAEQGHVETQTFHEHPGDGWTITSESKHVTQEYVAGAPEQGTPTIEVEVPNPDYVAPTYTPATKVWVAPVYTPPIGKPTIIVENDDYVEAYTETVEHEAVVCDEPAVDEEEVEKSVEKVAAGTATAKVAATADAAEQPDTLAATGMNSVVTLTGGALAIALIAGGSVLAIRNRQKKQD